MTQLVRRSPWWMADFDPDMGRLLGRAFGAWMDPRGYRVLPLARADRWMPACDVFVRGGDLVVRMELPGIDPDTDVQVSVEDGVRVLPAIQAGRTPDSPAQAGLTGDRR